MTRQERMKLRRERKKEAKQLDPNMTTQEMDAAVENEPSGDVDQVDMLGDVLMAVTAVQTILERIEKMYAMDLKCRYGVEFKHA